MHLHATDYKFKHIYNMKTLKDYCDYAENDIKRAEEHIRKIREYQRALYEHVQEVVNTEVKPVVRMHRSEDYNTKKKQYSVCIEMVPQVEKEYINGDRVYAEYKEQKNFIGTERREAIKYAEELSKQYRCEIQKVGNWRT